MPPLTVLTWLPQYLKNTTLKGSDFSVASYIGKIMDKQQRKKWEVKFTPDKEKYIDEISEATGLYPTMSKLLVNRGYTDIKSANDFLGKRTEILHDPFLLEDMQKGASKILECIESGRKIMIYGDYDVDGITSVSILYLYLSRAGANVGYYIPSRKGEGYGVSSDAVKKAASAGTSLIITVDTGITANREVEEAKALGVDFVITDHHECPDVLPDAYAVINPKRSGRKYPFPFLAGVGVVFKLLCALEAIKSGEPMIDCVRRIFEKYSDLTAIGTIADVMPVTDENRIIISHGLSLAEHTDKIGLEKLINLCRSNETKTTKQKAIKKLSSGFVGFVLAPKINAAGRISDASIAVELFLTEDESTAEKLALKLCEINRERQLEENKIAEEANEYIDKHPFDKSGVIIIENDTWNHGVIGIVSSRITEKYSLPSVLISFEGNEDPTDPEAIGKGSGRSIGGMNLVNALSSCSDLLEKYGGHELAAGLSVKRKNLEEFKKRMNGYANKFFGTEAPVPTLDIDCEVSTDEINLSLASEISMLEPYGVSNPTPLFVLRDARIEDIIPVGMNRHLKIRLSKGKFSVNAMLFGTSSEEFSLNINDLVDVAFNLEINDFMGTVSPQMNIKDIRTSESEYLKELENERIYDEVKAGVSTLDPSYIIPAREDFSLIYRFLLREAREGRDEYTVTRLLYALEKSFPGASLNYVKIKLAIKVIRELNIVSVEEKGSKAYKFKFTYSKNKTSLDKSSILKTIKGMYPQRNK